MPNLDGGHLFLTVLVPVRLDTAIDPFDAGSRSHRHLLAERLALIPTGRQTAASDPLGPESPFARNMLNHFARFVMIDGPAYNGRNSGDTVIGVLKGTDPLVGQPVDGTHPYLLFAADVDASGDADATLKTYTATLWETMGAEIRGIFQHCVGFDSVRDAAGFHAYIQLCQIETTMPFNDYWLDGMPVGASGAASQLPHYVKMAVSAFTAYVIALFCVVALHFALVAFGVEDSLSDLAARLAAWGSIGLAAVLCIALLALYGAYRWALGRGAQPLPTAPGSDLPSVLKSLFLQQQFVRFVLETQGSSDQTIHARFGAFLGATAPQSPSPSQSPGEIASPATGW
jgi:hypothetical protein